MYNRVYSVVKRLMSKKMPRINKGVGKEATQFKGTGAGIGSVAPIPTRYPADIDALLRSLPNRSEKIREWVIEGLKREGLLE
jgi:hypothetical protein